MNHDDGIVNETIQKFKETTSQLMKEINEKKQTIQCIFSLIWSKFLK